ncbi:MAG: tetratricopeptide repeat protein [Bacteroidetes bacterium]|nr:MAG: tetratricopeptide repeat protein [Bacteroidota bacterium]
MQNKKILAALIGAACLLIVFVLSKKHLNKDSQLIEPVAQVTMHSEVSWEDILGHFNEEAQLPNTIAMLLGDSMQLEIKDTGYINTSIEFCYKNQYFLPAAFIQLKKARLVKDLTSWIKATESIHTLGMMEQDTSLRSFMMAQVISSSNEILGLDAENMKGHLYQALALADKRETMMNAVPHLLSVVRTDENNIPALYTLGLLSIESGQLDKALQRFEKLVSLQPSNPEYHLRLASVYEQTGNKSDALKHYERCLALTTDNPAMQEELKQIITNLK